MSECPSGWALGSLNDLVAAGGLFSDGDWIESKDQDPDGENRLLQLADIGDGVFIDKSSRFVNNEKFHLLNCTELHENDLLIARMPDPLGRACLMPGIAQRCLTVVDVAIFRSGIPDISHKLLMHFINSPEVRKSIELESSGTTRKRIARGKLTELKLPIPPAAEQTRIAQKLDELLAQVDTLKARINAIPALLKRFRQSIHAAAVSGRLTEEWRKGAEPNWTFQRAADLCEKVQSGGTPKEGFSEVGVPFLKVYNIVNQKIDFSYRPQYITESIHKGSSAKSITKPGDIVMNIVGPPLGKIATIPADHHEWNINQAITLFRPSEKIISGWITIVLEGGECLRNIMNETKGSAGQVNISLSQCRNLIFPTPSIDEQMEAVRRVEQLFAFADQLEDKVTSAKSRIDQLTQSILAKAFRGELVPQDSNEEPASILLERIATSKLNKPSKPRKPRAPKSTRPTQKNNAMTKHRLDDDVLAQPYLAEHLRRLGSKATAEALFKAADLPVADFYKQLAWEVAQGLVLDLGETLEVKNEA
ncbi:MAG: restriction endonuclease subunit S [Pseudomonas sp.]|uniref:restriction endonuclease subunit S n=1 Tax=Pseudomonas sp. TaxID=306 RepID=UPI003D6E6CC6